MPSGPASSSGEAGIFLWYPGWPVCGWLHPDAARISRNEEFQQQGLGGFLQLRVQNHISATFVPANIMWLNTSPNAAAGVNILTARQKSAKGVVGYAVG